MTQSPTQNLDLGTRLALERTRLAFERTMLAWIRSATSLITFGFTIYKFVQLMGHGDEKPNHFEYSHAFALFLIFLGLMSLIFATVEYHRNIRDLRQTYFPEHRSLSVAVASLIGVLGVVAVVLVVLKL